MNLKAKCFRYRGFFQWIIVGVLVIVLVRFGVSDIYPAILGSEVKEVDQENVNVQREADKLQQMQIEEKKREATVNETPDKKPELPPPPPPPATPAPQERQRAQEVDHQKKQDEQNKLIETKTEKKRNRCEA